MKSLRTWILLREEKTLKMEIFAAQRYKEQNAINFLKKHPQLKGIAKGIQYLDTDIEKAIKIEPLEQTFIITIFLFSIFPLLYVEV